MKIASTAYRALIALLVALPIIGCSEDVYDIDVRTPSLVGHYLGVMPTEFNFKASVGDTLTAWVETYGNPWQLSELPDWLHAIPTSGKSDGPLSIVADANETVDKRQAVFYITASDADWHSRQALTATQSGAAAYISMDDKNQEFRVSCERQNIEIGISTNIQELTITFSKDWGLVTYDSESKKISLALQQNDSETSREGFITIAATGIKTQKISVIQYASGISIGDGEKLTFDADGGVQTVNINSDLAWTAKTSSSWLEVSPESGGVGETKISIRALPSYEATNRNGTIDLYIGETARTYVSVSQTGRYIKLSRESVSLSSDENAEATVSIDANVAWKVSSAPDWLTISPSQGSSGNSTIKLAASKNNSLNSRSGTVVFSDASSSGIESKLEVTQDRLDFGEQQLEFDWHSGSVELNLEFPNAWLAAVSSGWISLSNYVGTGPTTVTVSVGINNGEATRTGSISLVSEGKTFDIPVIQEGQYIHLSTTGGEVPAMGGTLQFYISSTVATENAVVYGNDVTDWVHLKEEDNYFNLTIDYNPSINARESTFVISPSDDDVSEANKHGVKFGIKQFGRHLATSTSMIEMFAIGGTSDIFTITADGGFSVTKPDADSWYVLVPNYSANTFYVVVTQNSTSVKRNSEISIVLNNLPDGEKSEVIVPLTQYPSGYNINLDNFNNETEW